MAEQLPLKETVVGSIPTGPTIAGSSNGRTRDFESRYLSSTLSPAASKEKKEVGR